MVGIPSESIETQTFSQYELKQIRKVQVAVLDYYSGLKSYSVVKNIISSSYISATTFIFGPLGSFLAGISISGLEWVSSDENSVMISWLKNGRDLIDKAINTGSNNVTIKYMKLTWRTSGLSIIRGGMVLR